MARKTHDEQPREPAGSVSVTVVLPFKVASQLDDHAKSERRSRSQAAALLIEDALAVKAKAAS